MYQLTAIVRVAKRQPINEDRVDMMFKPCGVLLAELNPRQADIEQAWRAVIADQAQDLRVAMEHLERLTCQCAQPRVPQ